MVIMKKSLILIAVYCLGFMLLAGACGKKPAGNKDTGNRKLSVIASLFPVYDFARQVGGEKAEVSLLLPPGTEPHSFDPRPGDILALGHADLFFYTNVYMEPWARSILSGVSNPNLLAIDTSEGIELLNTEDAENHSGPAVAAKASPGDKGTGNHRGHIHGGPVHGGKDPHLWLDPLRAIRMVENIRDAFIRKDPANAVFYTQNASAYTNRLKSLDERYKASLAECGKKVFVNGGHFTFGYLARRYGLSYVSAYGLSPNSEPTPGSLARVSRTLKENGLRHIYFEELLAPRVAGTIAKETGAELLLLHGAHNISREDFIKGRTFLSFMEANLVNLKAGLQCR